MLQHEFVFCLTAALTLYINGICWIEVGTTKFAKFAGRFNIFAALFILISFGSYATDEYRKVFDPDGSDIAAEEKAYKRYQAIHDRRMDLENRKSIPDATKMALTSMVSDNQEWQIQTPAGNIITWKGLANGVRTGGTGSNGFGDGDSGPFVGRGRSHCGTDF